MPASAESQLLAELRRLAVSAEPLKARIAATICLEIARWGLTLQDARDLYFKAEKAGLQRAAKWLEKIWGGCLWIVPPRCGTLSLTPGRTLVRFGRAGSVWFVESTGGELWFFAERGEGGRRAIAPRTLGGVVPAQVGEGLVKFTYKSRRPPGRATRRGPECVLRCMDLSGAVVIPNARVPEFPSS